MFTVEFITGNPVEVTYKGLGSQIEELEIESDSTVSSPHLAKNGIILIRDYDSSYFNRWNNTIVVEKEPDNVVLHHLTVHFSDEKKSGFGEPVKSRTIEKIQLTEYNFRLVKDDLVVIMQDISHSFISDYIRRDIDLVRSPFNRPIWEYIYREEPLYDGKRLFVSPNAKIYIAIEPSRWLSVSAGWIEENRNSLPEEILTEWNLYLNVRSLE